MNPVQGPHFQGNIATFGLLTMVEVQKLVEENLLSTYSVMDMGEETEDGMILHTLSFPMRTEHHKMYEKEIREHNKKLASESENGDNEPTPPSVA
ncbi:hypothetical protein PMW_205 [Pseudomonas phage phiPMW]|uniref:Uncharacterized protein n=1 Tax=Pseudomonas phage phiPMW TaxID=1815582 RepID=A0A1S5R1N7_9CAUD|nr:hypothetical protein FDG97_gp145 [Pseudomonas phage phiPMW]ANA49330.1 hypothetical protein PMW_205 [Pseudomonas phage phiPMW]